MLVMAIHHCLTPGLAFLLSAILSKKFIIFFSVPISYHTIHSAAICGVQGQGLKAKSEGSAFCTLALSLFQPISRPLLLWSILLLLSVVLNSYLATYRQGVEARALGAKLPPQLKGKIPGNLDILWRILIKADKDGYPGQGAIDIAKRLGTTWTASFIGKKAVCSL
jgi:hypothetical protein